MVLGASKNSNSLKTALQHKIVVILRSFPIENSFRKFISIVEFFCPVPTDLNSQSHKFMVQKS